MRLARSYTPGIIAIHLAHADRACDRLVRAIQTHGLYVADAHRCALDPPAMEAATLRLDMVTHLCREHYTALRDALRAWAAAAPIDLAVRLEHDLAVRLEQHQEILRSAYIASATRVLVAREGMSERDARDLASRVMEGTET